MAGQSTGAPQRRRLIASNDQLMAVWAGWILFVTLLVWTAAGGSGGPGEHQVIYAGPAKYVIYSLPLSFGAAYYLSFGAALRVDYRALAALAMYAGFAGMGMVANAWDQFYALRDFIIITSYLVLFIFWFRAPASIIGVALAAVVACLTIEAASRIRPGLTWIDANGLYAILGLTLPSGKAVFGPHGILESTLGFPLGIIVLFYLYNRKWWPSAIAGLLQLLAFKRITFAGVAIALAFDALVGRKLPFESARRIAVVVAVGLSILAIFSTGMIQDAANLLAVSGSSPNGISLGRYDIAIVLWDSIKEATVLNWLIGFGAGAADTVSEATAYLNPHNDWLKILFDYGILGSAMVHAIFFLILARHRLGLMLYLYTAALLMTDNIFIYMFYYPFIALAMCTEQA